jgi:hypothetical protein
MRAQDIADGVATGGPSARPLEYAGRMSESDRSPSRPRVTRATPRTVDAAPPDQPALSQASAGPLLVRQGGLQEAHAEAIDVQQGGIGRAYATDIAVSKGAIGYARGQQVWIEMGGAGLVVAGDARISQGGARSVLAKSVHLEQGAVGTVIAASVDIGKPAAVGVVIAREVRGDIRPLLDWRGALALGAVLALLVRVVRRP